jgi:hypothetical protein
VRYRHNDNLRPGPSIIMCRDLSKQFECRFHPHFEGDQLIPSPSHHETKLSSSVRREQIRVGTAKSAFFFLQTAEREILDAVVGRVWGPDVSELGNLAYYVEDDPRKRSVKTVHRAMEPRTRKATEFRIPRPWLKKFDLSAPICPTGVNCVHDS